MKNLQEKVVSDKIKFVQDTLYVMGGKWKLPILIAIYYSNNRFKDIKKCIPHITNHTLAKELKELEANRLITKTIISSVLIKYDFTPYCMSLSPVIKAMTEWGEQHRKKITGK